MNFRSIIFLICTFLAPCFIAQSQNGAQVDSLILNTAERVDTLVKYVRKQFYSNNYGQTIVVGEETLKLARKIDDKSAILRVSSLMGNAFLQNYDTIQAKRIFFRAIQDAEKQKDTTRSLTTARIDLGNLYALQENYDLAIELYKEAIPIAAKLNDTTHLFILNFNIADVSLEDEDIETAEYYVARTNEYVQGVKADAYHAVAQINNTELLYLQDKHEEAIPYLKESIRLATASGYTDALIEAHEIGAKIYIALGDFEQATNHLVTADELNKDKYKTDKIRAVETITAKFKLDQYKQDLKAQELQSEIDRRETKRQTTNFWIKIATAIILVSSIILLFSYLRRKKLLKDLIKRNKQYQEAKEVSEAQVEAKNRLFANITHELRTPLYGIIGISSFLMDDAKLRHQASNLQSLKFSADYLLSLINNVLQFTQTRGSARKLIKTEFDLRKLIDNVVESSKYLNTGQPNNYELSIDHSIPQTLVGDLTKLSQILMNLISNASKFTNNGLISIRVDRGPDKNGNISLHFEIEDNGIGISEEGQKQILDDYEDLRSNYQQQGTGLGIPIVKRLLKLHGSDMQLRSIPNRGTRISFTLFYEPIPDLKISEEHTSATEFTHNCLNNKNILVVDDNKVNLLVTRKTLEKYGATVSVAHNGKEGVHSVRTKEPDLVLMDINMPKMNGYQATELIRSFNKGIPIIALTAVEEEKLNLENQTNLFNDFVIKPYKQEDFIALISNYISVAV